MAVTVVLAVRLPVAEVVARQLTQLVTPVLAVMVAMYGLG
jgi:hypothetical protein